jgi:group I intron endonuclease
MPKRKTQQQILREFHQAHGNYYDYSLVQYVSSQIKVKILCPTHGEFQINPGHHKNGVGCRKCYFESQRISKQEFIARSEQHFGKRYDYSLFDVLLASGNQVKIACKEHNITFLQEPRSHMRGHTGCSQCLSDMLSGPQEKRGEIKSREELNIAFMERSQQIYGERYNYTKFKYISASSKGEIICTMHGSFHQSPSNHLKSQGCPKCCHESKYSNSFKNKCKEMGVDYWRALKRREAGLPEDKIFEKQHVRNSRKTTEIEIYGTTYPNLKEAIRSLNPPAGRETIARWIRKGIPPEEAFDRIPNPGYAEGIIYLIQHKNSGKQYVGLTIQTLERRWKHHVEQAYSGYIKGEESLHHAIREYGPNTFEIREIDQGTSKKDLEKKEIEWIKKLETLVPNGYNISTGGTSGGSNRKSIYIDNMRFESIEKAAIYVSETRKISLSAAAKRINQGRIDVKTPAKSGESLVKTKAYKSWSRIVHGAINPKSKEYIPGLEIYKPWRDFHIFLEDVGNPPQANMAFSRLDKGKGFFPDNCAWLTKSESSRINTNNMRKQETSRSR